MKRSRINPKRREPRRSRHPIRPEGDWTPAEELEARAEELAALERCHRRKGCAAHIAPDCRDRNEHAHHRKLLSQGGPTNDVNLLNVCSRCHLWIHDNVAEATERGLIVPSWFGPAEWPVGGAP